MRRRRIAIVGAGPGGLACAALTSGDNDVTVFDQFKAPKPVGSGLVIQPVGQDVLAAAGATAAFDLGQWITRMIGIDVDLGQPVLDVSYDHQSGARRGLAIHRGALMHALLQAVDQSEAGLVPDAAVVATDGEGLLHLADGRREGPFELIIDAAGARSPLSPLHGRALAFGALWANVRWPESDGLSERLPLSHLSQRYRSAQTMAGILPIGRLPGQSERRAALFWSMRTTEYEAWQAAPLAAWAAQVTALWPDLAPFLAQIEDHEALTFARYTHGTLARPVSGRVVHIGDAAHRASPQLGQGANMALLVARALDAALRQHHHLPDALTTYAKARRFHVWAYQTMSALFTPQYQSDGWFAPNLRDRVLAPLSQIPPLPRSLSRLVCGDLVPPFGSLTVDDTG